MAVSNPEIAIVGAGPSGCALACFLRQRGAEVIVFDNGKRPDLLVGESLIPAAIPLIQRLGIEEEVKRVSVVKPGATLLHADGLRIDLGFKATRGKAPGYAYNIPRPAFDTIIARRAKQLGVRFVHERAQLTRTEKQHAVREISLSNASLDAAGLSPDSHPSLLVDATGRTRLFARMLDIESVRGNRNDTAYFAHFENCTNEEFPPGQIIITVLKQGWSWRIPLQGKMSVGVVLNQHAARLRGDSPQSRLDATLRDEPLLAKCMAGATQITNVKTYSNYQLLITRGYGPGWVMVGDAFGFVDPMLSPGVFMALESAVLLDQNIGLNANHTPHLSLDRYCRDVTSWHAAWQEVIEYLYDGRLLQLYEAGKEISANASIFSGNRFLDWYYRRLVRQLVSGVATRSTFKRRMLKAGVEHLTDSEIKSSRLAVIDS